MPPRDYFTDEIRRQLSAKLGDEQLFTGGLSIRATVDPELQEVAAQALRDGLEQLRPRHPRLPRAGGADRPRQLRSRPTRRAGAARSATPRCRATSPAGTRRSSSRSARARPASASRASRRTPTATSSPSTTPTGARMRGDNGRLRAAQGPDDMWDVGDVVLVKAIESDGETALVLPPDPGDPGRLHGDGHRDRPRPRHAGRLLLPVERLQPRHPGAAPARLVVQALRLRRRARQRLLARRRSCSTRRSRWRPAPASGRRRTPAATTTARPRSAPASSSRAT